MSLLFLLIFSEITLSHIRSIAIFAPRIIHVNEPSVLNTDEILLSALVKNEKFMFDEKSILKKYWFIQNREAKRAAAVNKAITMFFIVSLLDSI